VAIFRFAIRETLSRAPLVNGPAWQGEMRGIASWLEGFAAADLDEPAADGGVTVGMVYQQEAGYRARRLREHMTGGAA
jgi:hypothetical protein